MIDDTLCLILIILFAIFLWIIYLTSGKLPSVLVVTVDPGSQVERGFLLNLEQASKFYGVPVKAISLPSDEQLPSTLQQYYSRGYRHFVGFIYSSSLAVALPFIKSHPDATFYVAGATSSYLDRPANTLTFVPLDNITALQLASLISYESGTRTPSLCILVQGGDPFSEGFARDISVYIPQSQIIVLGDDTRDTAIIGLARRVSNNILLCWGTKLPQYLEQLKDILPPAPPRTPKAGENAIRYYLPSFPLVPFTFPTRVLTVEQSVDMNSNLVPYGRELPIEYYTGVEIMRYIRQRGQVDAGLTGPLNFDIHRTLVGVRFASWEYSGGNWRLLNKNTS